MESYIYNIWHRRLFFIQYNSLETHFRLLCISIVYSFLFLSNVANHSPVKDFWIASIFYYYEKKAVVNIHVQVFV